MFEITTTSEPQYNSPFDAIRGYRVDGSEYWTARELMRFLGFSKWEKFLPIVLDAIEDIEIISPGTSAQHIPRSGKSPKSGGRELVDYELSRLGCYHVTLACKQRTPEVAAARRYFATKTREAEIVIPAQNDRLRELELQLQLSRSETQRSLAEKAVLDTRHLIVCTCPELVQ